MDITKKVLYGVDIMKRRQYWPRYICNNNIKSHFNNNDVGAMDALRGDLDNVPLCVFAIKVGHYFVILMSAYGTNEQFVKDKFRMIGADRIAFN